MYKALLLNITEIYGYITTRGKSATVIMNDFLTCGEIVCKHGQTFEKLAEIPATTSGNLQLHALITCNSGQHFAGNSERFPFDVIVFAMLAAYAIGAL